MKTLPTFEATCARCGATFSHPSLGDFSYGEALLCSANGKSYATVDGSTALARQVGAASTPSKPGELWRTLAALADKIDGQPMTASIRCPHCASETLASWGGRTTGTRDVPEASFQDHERLAAPPESD